MYVCMYTYIHICDLDTSYDITLRYIMVCQIMLYSIALCCTISYYTTTLYSSLYTTILYDDNMYTTIL